MSERRLAIPQQNRIRDTFRRLHLLGGLCLAGAVSLPTSVAKSQGLRSAAASVSLVVIKPVTDASGPRTREGSIPLPPEWRTADAVTLEGDATSSASLASLGIRLFVRDSTHRLFELRAGSRVLVASGSAQAPVRMLIEADGQAPIELFVRAIAVWRDRERQDVRLLPITFGAR